VDFVQPIDIVLFLAMQRMHVVSSILFFDDASYACFSDSIIAVRHCKMLCDLNWFLAMEYSKVIVS
jgi:hypothetical protein